MYLSINLSTISLQHSKCIVWLFAKNNEYHKSDDWEIYSKILLMSRNKLKISSTNQSITQTDNSKVYFVSFWNIRTFSMNKKIMEIWPLCSIALKILFYLLIIHVWQVGCLNAISVIPSPEPIAAKKQAKMCLKTAILK